MINSMTGYATAAGVTAGGSWSWELKTVNAKGLDLRVRLPQGFDALDADIRRTIGARLLRGTCQATFTVTREVAPALVRINTEILTALMREVGALSVPPTIRPASLDGLLAIRGVVEAVEPSSGEAEKAALHEACRIGLDQALEALCAMRAGEGLAMERVLVERLDTIARLTHAADVAPQRQAEAVKDKLARSIAALGDRHQLDPDRLHQEALLLAAKADVREELDRLAAHVVAARTLLATRGGVGRRLDFLAQELAREANTFCAKSNDAALTAIGLELRVEIEQFREQVQNIE